LPGSETGFSKSSLQRSKHRALARYIYRNALSANDISHKIDELHESMFDVLGYILENIKKYKYAYPSRVTIGKAVGLHPSTVSEKTGILKDLGILEIKQNYNDSNCYYATPLLNNLLKTPVLYKRFPHLRLFSVVLLTAFTLFNNPSSNINKIDPTLSLISKRSLLKYNYIKEKDLHYTDKKQSVKTEKFTRQESQQGKSKFLKKTSSDKGDDVMSTKQAAAGIAPTRIKDQDKYKVKMASHIKEQHELKRQKSQSDPLREIAKLRVMANKPDSTLALMNGIEFAQNFYNKLANTKERDLIKYLEASQNQ